MLWNKSRRPMIAPQQAVASDAPLQAANQQVSLISSRLSHRMRGTPDFGRCPLSSEASDFAASAALRLLAIPSRL